MDVNIINLVMQYSMIIYHFILMNICKVPFTILFVEYIWIIFLCYFVRGGKFYRWKIFNC